MSEFHQTGSCFCRQITAEVTGTPFWVCFDHDQDCRRASGAPLMVWVGYHPEQVHIIKGSLRTFSRTRGVVRGFCGDCGTSISYLDEGLPDEIYLALGFLNHPERFAPQAHAYWRERLPWIDFADGLPRIDGYSRERAPGFGKPRDR